MFNSLLCSGSPNHHYFVTRFVVSEVKELEVSEQALDKSTQGVDKLKKYNYSNLAGVKMNLILSKSLNSLDLVQ